MADPNTRQGKRTPVTLKIKFKSETLEQFIERYAVDVSQGGIFIRTKEPLAVGTQMKFEFQLRDASPLIAGEGTVVWTRENDPSRPAIAPGMGVRFDRLAEGSQSVLERILQEKAKLAPQRSHAESSKPPMFTDTPTRVAPAPVQEALLSPNKRPRSDSEQTPLPKPMPFHSDADEFPDEAFEEATKVRSLDDLVAATAGGAVGEERTEMKAPPPEDDARSGRADSTLADPPAAEEPRPAEDETDAAPGLPSPPEVSAAAATRPGKLLDTTPSPRPSAEPEDEPAQAEPEPAPAASQMKTRLGVEAPAKKRPTTPPAEARRTPEPAPASAREPAPKRPSTAPIWIGGLVVVAIGLAAVWYFFLRNDLQRATEGTGSAEVASGSPETGSAAMPGSAVAATGSAGSGVAMEGSAGSAGSAEAMAGSETVPAGPTVNTVVAADIAKATVEVEGTDQHGTVPFTAKLEQGKSYKVRVSAPGYLAQELDVQGGKDKVVAKLVAKPHVVSVTSTPPGAAIYIDGSNTGKYTPYDVELTASQAARPRVRVTLRKSGYASREQVITSSAFTEGDASLSASVEATLPVSVPLHSGGSSAHNASSGTGSAGSASTSGNGEAGSASGSAATPEGGATSPDTGGTKPDTGATKPDTGAGSAAAKPSGGEGSGGAAAAGSAGPTPSWAH